MPCQSRCSRCPPDENNDNNNNDNNNDRVWQGSARHPPDSNRAAKGTRMSKLLTGAPVAGTSIAGTPVTRTLITCAAPTCTVTPDTAAISSSPVVVTATISLPKSPTVGPENSAKHGSVSLTNLMVTPTQD